MNWKGQLAERLGLARSVVRETPIVELSGCTVTLLAKLEFFNGVGSIKDRPAFWILEKAIERGEIGPNTTIVESSSGNFACALATFCKILELNFIPVIDPIISPFYESTLRTLCSRVVKVGEPDEAGGYLKTRLRVVQKLLLEIPDSYWPNQYGNPDGMEAHYYQTGAEINKEASNLDYVFLGVSSGGTIAGVSRCLKERNPSIRIIAVDAEGSVIFGRKPQKRRIPGLGSSIIPSLLRHALVDDVTIVTEEETITGCHQLLREHNLFVGGSTGATYSAIQRYFREKLRGARPRVLFLCCDRGTPYLHSVFNRQWVRCGFAESQPVPQAV